MSQVTISGNASGTGIFTIASPNSNSNVTLTLPDQTGTLFANSVNGALNVNAAAPANSLVIDSVGEVTRFNTNPGGFTIKRTDGVNSNGWLNFVGSDDAVDGSVRMATDVANALTFQTAATERARIDSSGNMMWNGTNTTTSNGNAGYTYKFFGGNNNLIIPLEVGIVDRYSILEFRQTGRTNSARASQISIGQNSASQGDVQVYSSGANADISGGVRLSNGATSWSAISDMRLKTVTGTYTNALQDIAQIQAIKFTWKHDQSGTPQVGVSAQSVELVVPEAISTSKNIATPDDETEYLAVRYTELIPLLIASIQEQQALITSLTARITALEAK